MQDLSIISWVIISIVAIFIIRGTFRYLRKRRLAREEQEAQRLYRKDIISYSKYSNYSLPEKKSKDTVTDVSIVDSYLWDSFGSSSSSSGCSSSGCSSSGCGGSGCGGGCGGGCS